MEERIICSSEAEEKRYIQQRIETVRKESGRKIRTLRGDRYHVSVEKLSDVICLYNTCGFMTLDEARHLHQCLSEAIVAAEANVGCQTGADDDGGHDYFMTSFYSD